MGHRTSAADPQSAAQPFQPAAPWHRRLAILLGALCLLWPAFWSGFPLIYPDSMAYLDTGRLVAARLFLHRIAPYYGMRSLLYSLAILPLHWNITPWPIVFANAWLLAWLLWLVLRAVTRRESPLAYLVLIASLALFTSLSWYTSVIMPDILGPAAYLCAYLLVFARATLRRAERIGLVTTLFVGLAAHLSHVLLAAGLCALLFLTQLITQATPRRRHGITQLAGMLLLAIGLTAALNAVLYGRPSLDSQRLPYLTARLLEDGPARQYLQQHCAQQRWLICGSVATLPTDADEFLWSQTSIWTTATPDQQTRLRAEEMPLVYATLLAYPRQQLAISVSNARDQLLSFGIHDLDRSEWAVKVFPRTMPASTQQYLRSRQAHNAMQLDLFSDLQRWVVAASLTLLAAAAPWLWRTRPTRLLWLTAIVAYTVLTNALISGVLSMVDDRLESRVIWLIPLLAGITALTLKDTLLPSRNTKP